MHDDLDLPLPLAELLPATQITMFSWRQVYVLNINRYISNELHHCVSLFNTIALFLVNKYFRRTCVE